MLMEKDVDRLCRILTEIHEHGGAITLWSDKTWLQRVQLEKPAWAAPIFDKYKDVPQITG